MDEIPKPPDWIITIEETWSAWAHSLDGEFGVKEYGKTKDEAISKLKKRMEEWAYLKWRDERNY